MKKEYNTLKGSYTVEAALILPFIIYLILLIFYVSFFLYDQCIIVENSYSCLLRAERENNSLSEKRKIAEEKYEETITKRLVGITEIKTDIEIEKENLSIFTNSSMIIPISIPYIGEFNALQKMQIEKYAPVQYIRNCKKAENLWKWIRQGESKDEAK